ncbi:MAG TPA: transglutaminase-like cysteine peptidase [Xanthobacteraceae bacterium]
MALLAVTAWSAPAIAGAEPPLHVPVYEVTRPPAGWVEFCVLQPGECAGNTAEARELAVSAEFWNELLRVNDWVNETVKPLTDLEHWGVVERWSYPDDGYGDCEDYVLLKRRLLIEAGWPVEALLITVVRDRKGEAHAVLTVATDRGDYILDNQNEDVRLWWQTGYRFLKRQSQSDPNLWVSLGQPRPASATAASR